MKEKVTIVVFSGEMDRAVASFIIATTAASMGMEVTMFFTFWGLNVIKKPSARGGKGIMRKMLNWMNRGTADRLPLSRFNMLGMGPWMMRKLMRESRLPLLEDMIPMAKALGVNLIACTTTLGLMDLNEDDFIPEVDSLAGAATYVGEARKSQVNLFI